MKDLNIQSPFSTIKQAVISVVVLILIGYVISRYLEGEADYVTTEARGEWAVSCFVYRDDNRNGIFDMADRPYAGLSVEIERPDGSIASNKSNVAGFANFKVARGISGATNLDAVGSYKVSAIPALGWKITSDMEPNQNLTTSADSNVGGKMILSPPCAHIGVSADLTVSGQIALLDGLLSEEVMVEVSKDGQDTLLVPLNDSGAYTFPVVPGEWRLDVSNKKTGAKISRQIEIDSISAVLSEISFEDLSLGERTGIVETIDFDDFTSSETLYEIPSGYHDLHWQYWVATHIKFYNGSGYVNAAVSDEYIAYNSSGFPASFSSKETFDFVGAYVTAAWPRGAEGTLTVKAWRDGEIVYEDLLSISPSGPIYFSADYVDVQKVEFVIDNRERAVIDNVSIRR